MDEFVRPKNAAKHFGVGLPILRGWERDGKIKSIRTKGINGHRRYNISSYKNSNIEPIFNESRSIQNDNIKQLNVTKKKYCYIRVSSNKQKDDLRRQEEYIKSIYPTYEIIKDIGSGLNFKRAGLISLFEESARGCVEEVVVAYKDRLCRFGFDLIFWFFTYYNVKLTILNKNNQTPDEELTGDLLSIIHVFSCRANGSRKYKKKENNEENTKQN